MPPIRPGRIILLNGTSSSGKTSIAEQLLLMLNPPYFHMSVDAINSMRAEAGLAAAQQHQVHAHGIYDIECDTTTATPRECAIQIKDFLAREQPPTAFDRLRALLLGDLLVSSRQPRSPCHLTSYARTSMPLGSPCLARPLVESGAGLECIALAYLTAAKD